MGYEISDINLEGPRGGNLKGPPRPEYRNASLQPQGGEGLHCFVDTAKEGLKNEKAWHRMAAYMMVAGVMNKDIAAAAGVTPEAVSILKAQRWFQELLAKLATQEGQEITGLLKAEAVASLQTMVEMRDSAESERVRYQAAKDLVELAHGKATQRIVTDNVHRAGLSPKDEMAEIQQQLATLREREKNV